MGNHNNPGIKEIAKLAGVSIGTIDRVLHNRTGVSDATRKKVLKIIQETGYKKNIIASRLKLAAVKKIKIAILIPEIKDEKSYWKWPKEGIRKAILELKEQGISVSYFYFNSFVPQDFQQKAREILSLDFDAIVTVPFFKEESEQLLDRTQTENIPVVFLDTQQRLGKQANYINQNSYTAGMVAGRLLHGLVGDEGLYFVVSITNERGIQINNLQRENGFRSFFKKNYPDKRYKIHTIHQPLEDHVDIEKEILQLLDSPVRKGIFVTNARSFLLLDILKSNNIQNTYTIGFDLNKQNMNYLESGDINFLINQKPEYQGYAAVKGLYKFLITQDESELNIDIPIDIRVKENAIFFDSPAYTL